MLSLVMPCFNETEVLRLTFETLMRESANWQDDFELILVDDGSSDDTWTIISELVTRDRRVKGLRLSRNFGHQAAMGAGLEAAVGDAIIVLDADLQDPPGVITQMIAKWREGYEVVYAQRNRRAGETKFKLVTAALFYRLLDKITSISIPRDTGDFALLDAKVVRTLIGLKEHALFWRGLRKWIGYKHTAIKFDRPERAGGQTKYTLKKMIRLASDGLLSFSTLPLRLPLYAGAAALALSGLLTIGWLAAWIFGWQSWPVNGVALALFYFGGVQLLSLGVVGEYLNRIYEEVRGRPRWIVSETIGAAQPATQPQLAPARKAA